LFAFFIAISFFGPPAEPGVHFAKAKEKPPLAGGFFRYHLSNKRFIYDKLSSLFSAFCKTVEKFIPFFSAIVLSQVGIVRVFLIALLL